MEGHSGGLLRPRLLPGHVRGGDGPGQAGPDRDTHNQRGKCLLQWLNRLLAGLLGHHHRRLRPGPGLRRGEGAQRSGDRDRRREPGPVYRRRPHDGRVRATHAPLHGGDGSTAYGTGPGCGQGPAKRGPQPLRPPQADLHPGRGAPVPSHRRPFDTVPVLPHQRGCRRGYSMRRRRSGPVRN